MNKPRKKEVDTGRINLVRFRFKKYDNETNKNRCKYKYNKCNNKIFQA